MTDFTSQRAVNRRNDKMNEIFAKAKKDYPTSGLHGISKEDAKNHEKKEKMAGKIKKKHHWLGDTNEKETHGFIVKRMKD